MKLFTREQAVKIIDEILEKHAPIVMDAIINEHTDIDGEELLSMVEDNPEVINLHRINFNDTQTFKP